VHQDPAVVVKMDVKDFFPTVTLRRVKGIFRKAGYREQLRRCWRSCVRRPARGVVLDGQTYYVSLGPRCLPQGAPTSPALTNTLCLRLDRRLAGLAKRLGWRYTRYADDLTFSFPASHEGEPRINTLLAWSGESSKRRVPRPPGQDARPPPRRPAAGDRAGGHGSAPPRVPRRLRRSYGPPRTTFNKASRSRRATRSRAWPAMRPTSHDRPDLGGRLLAVLGTGNEDC